jgi:hypothetical protein
MPVVSERQDISRLSRRTESRSSRSWLWIVVLAVAYLAHAGIRWWLGREQTAPATSADENGYLMAARLLSGGAGGDLSGGTFYQAGYSLLLAPIYWITRDPDQVFKLAVVMNSFLGALLLPMCYAGLRRFQFGHLQAFLAGNALAALPVGIWYGQLAWSDALLPVIVLGWLLALHNFLRHKTVASALLCSALPGYASMVHSRGSVIVAAHLLTLLFIVWKSRAHRLLAFASMGVLAITYLIGNLINRYVLSELYPRGPRSLGDLLVQRVTSVDGISTWGLGAIGMAAATAVVFMPSRGRQARLIAALMVLTTLGLAFASCAALPVEYRVGNYAYGRYLSFFAIPYSLVGVVVLVRASLGRIALAGLGGAAIILSGYLAVTAYAGDKIVNEQFFAIDFPEMSFLTNDWMGLKLRGATIAGLALVAAVTVIAMLCRSPVRTVGPAKTAAVAAIALAIPVLVIDAAAANEITVKGTREWVKYADALSRPPVLPGERVAVDSRFTWEVPYQTMLRVWWTPLEHFDPTKQPPPARDCLVLVKPDKPALKPPKGWHVAGNFLDKWIAWRNDGCPDPPPGPKPKFP